MKYAAFIVLALAGSLSGCTTYVTSQAPRLTYIRNEDNHPLTGQPYYLPMSTYDMTVTWKVIGCKDGHPSIDIDPAVTERVVKGEMFVIDSNKLLGLARNGKLEISYTSDGFPSTVNAEGSDKTGEVATSLVGTLSKVVVAGIAAGKGPDTCGIVQPHLESQAKKLAALKVAQSHLTQAQKQLKDQQTAIDKSSAAATDAQRAGLSGAIDGVDRAQGEVDTAQSALDVENKFLSTQVKVEGWTPNVAADYPYTLSPPDLKQWIPQQAGESDIVYAGNIKALVEAQSLIVGLVVDRLPNEMHPKGQGAAKPISFPTTVNGIPYRVPRDVTFRFCNAKRLAGPCSNADVTQDPELERARKDHINAFQLGYPFVLEMAFQTFTTRQYAIEFSDNRIVKKVSVAQTKSAAEGLAPLLDAAADANQKIKKAKADSANADLTAQVAETKLKADLMDSQQKIAQITTQLATNASNADLQAQLTQETIKATLLKTKLDEINTQKAIDEANATLGKP